MMDKFRNTHIPMVRIFGIVFLILATSMLIFGCMKNAKTSCSVVMHGYIPVRRECPTNDTPFAEGSWREFRPFRVFFPAGAEIESCCLDYEFGRITIDIPGTGHCASLVVLADGRVDIDSMLEYYRSFSGCDEHCVPLTNSGNGNRLGEIRYTENNYPDRRLLMERRGLPGSEMTLDFFCEMDSGVKLFGTYTDCDIADSSCEWLWRFFRSIKVDIKCYDAFNCLAKGTITGADIHATKKIQWNELSQDIGPFEWNEFRQFRVFMPCGVKVECCCDEEDHFVFDMLDENHYVTGCCMDYEESEIDRRLELYSYSSNDLDGSIALKEKEKIYIALLFREMAGIDWYMEKKSHDRRLLIEHRHQSELYEGILCCCEFKEGHSVLFKVRGSGQIDHENLEYIIKICEGFNYEEMH